VLNPTFTAELIKRLETNARESRAFDGTMYMPGVVGENAVQ
jgi:U4/U6.U5 tri-snRNP-associated protein 2